MIGADGTTTKIRKKMRNRNGTFVALVLFLILFCDSTSSECMQLAPCICRLPDGSYYNLTGLADKEILINKFFNTTAYFHPCKNVLIPVDTNHNTTCSSGDGVSLCLHDANTNRTQNLGTVQDTRMKLSSADISSKNTFPVFEIHHVNVTSVINIVCVADSTTHFVIDTINPDTGKYHFILTSPYCCKVEPHHSGLSTGSVLIILLFTFSGIYFIGGAVILKTLRGATGWEMLPNHDFWCKLPSLVRDGIVFTFNCCRADSYERI